VPLPVAVAASAATQCDVADTVAVYDLGATFSASIARRDSAGFVLLGEPHVLEDGGGRFDEVVLARVFDELGDQVIAPDLDDPAVLAGVAQLLADCVAARAATRRAPVPMVTATVTLPTDEQILITREFDAPRHLVFRAWTTPELVKRCRGVEGDDPDALETLTKDDMVAATRDGVGVGEDAPDRTIEITIDYLGGGIASATCLCHRYVDLLELIEMPEGWRIINAVWCLR